MTTARPAADHDGGVAGGDDGVVHAHEAGTAEAQTAAEPAAQQAELVAEHGEQRGVRAARRRPRPPRPFDPEPEPGSSLTAVPSGPKISGCRLQLDPGAADVPGDAALGVDGVAAGDRVEQQAVLGVDHPRAGRGRLSVTNARR